MTTRRFFLTSIPAATAPCAIFVGKLASEMGWCAAWAKHA
jgi:hypothetical protein